MGEWKQVEDGVRMILEELIRAGGLKPGQLIVIGASTSEMAGRRIGTSGTSEAAAAVFAAVADVRDRHGLEFAFQCCEHLNRALVVERETMERRRLEEVSVVPVPEAGGTMAALAYRRMREPCVVEEVRAEAGIDIGDTLIGMHLRRVAVPFRPSVAKLGGAHVTAAYTRPKLIGGARAVYAPPAGAGEESDTCR